MMTGSSAGRKMKLCNKMNRVIFVMLFTIDVTCWSFQQLTAIPSSFRLKNNFKPAQLFSSNREGDENTSSEDWRDVRARLVMQYSQGEDIATKKSNSTIATTTQRTSAITSKSWAYDSKGAIEVGSLIISQPSQDSACGGLQQQHFHKCIVLVIDHSHEGTKGIILNRPANDIINDYKQNEWKYHFGGNTQGIGSENESLGCLYRENDISPAKNRMTLTILKNIGIVPWDLAQLLIDEEKIIKDNLRLYRGYTKWGKGQLEKELKSNDWFTVATDTESLWNIIAQDSNFSTGTDKWVQLMNRIGKGQLITSAPNQKFQDDMLKQYMRLKFIEKSNRCLRRSTTLPQKTQEDDTRINIFTPGTLVRSSSPIFLDEQVFHQSLVLILKNDDDMTIGVVLNRPYSTSLNIAGSTLPLRYGGRFELDDEGMTELWLHCNHQTLQEKMIGEPISKNRQDDSIFWKCSRKDAEAAVELGLANADDFLVVSGLSVWKNDQVSNAEGSSSVKLNDCFSKVEESSIDTIWKLLKIQAPLNKKNAAENLETANTAWMLSGEARWMLSGSSKQFDSRNTSNMDTKEQQVIQSLAFSALDKWIRMYLLKP